MIVVELLCQKFLGCNVPKYCEIIQFWSKFENLGRINSNLITFPFSVEMF